MNYIHRKNPFWSVAGPLIAYWGIQIGVQFIIQAIIQVPMMTSAYLEQFLNGQITNSEEVMESYLSVIGPAMEAVMKYETEITGAAALCTLPLTLILFRRDRKLEKSLGIAPPKKMAPDRYLPVALFGIAGTIAVTCLSAMAQAALYDPEYLQNTRAVYSAPFPIQLAVMGLIVPAAEEFMFRGIMFSRYRENRRFWYSALWSALFFSIMHTNTIQMVYTFLLGIMLAWLYEKFGSIKAPLLLHITLNLGALIFTQAGLFNWLAADLLRMALAVILSAFVCSVMFVQIRQMEGARIKEETVGNQEKF
ncbi:MAG TPA: CPBP family intramembrane metalloprotease [Candidatus Mediterraneibacter excrementigallinarum]|nr:CPBP family intramembrane metalloprotease [Candidatus Mediterraneibacter excrementigallinarum]